MGAISSVDFLVRSLAAFILQECPADTLLLAKTRPAPPPLTPFLLLPLFPSLLLSRLSFLLLSFFYCFLSSFTPESGYNPVSEDGTVTTVVATFAPIVTPPAVVVLTPPRCSLVNASKTPPKSSYILNYTELLCRSIVAPMPKLSERRYALRLVVAPCHDFPSPSPSVETISPYLSSHISSVAVPHLLRRRIYPCCPTSLPPCLSANVLTANLV